MSREFSRATEVALPSMSPVVGVYPSLNLADAFSLRLPADASGDPGCWRGTSSRTAQFLPAGVSGRSE